MANEPLSIPEECLLEVVEVIRAGIKVTKPSKEVRQQLESWCMKEGQYMLEVWRAKQDAAARERYIKGKWINA